MHDVISLADKASTLADADRFYQDAFARNLGLVSRAEQTQLRRSTVGIPGLGGVGGVHLITLVRAGIGGFHICDFDRFELQNFNRQYGARVPDLNRFKLEVMKQEALDINPHLRINASHSAIDEKSVDAFLDGVDIVVDSIDFFAFDARRLLFRRAWERNIPVVTAGPIGFTAAMLVFMPGLGMDFDRYFNITDDLSAEERTLRYQLGLCPNLKYLSTFDFGSIDHQTKAGPSLGLSCQLCAGVAAVEVMRILLKREGIRAVPNYSQFDPYTHRYIQGRLRGGGKNVIHRIKLALVRSKLKKSKPAVLPERPAPILSIGEGDSLPANVQRFLVSAAIAAPSGDNCQPWKFSWEKGRLRIYLERGRDRSLFNTAELASVISCGAAIENVRVAASGISLETTVDCLPAVDPIAAGECIAELSFESNDLLPNPLERAVWKRHSNRHPYQRRPLIDAVRDVVLTSANEFPEVRVHLIEGQKNIDALADVVCMADRIRVEHRGCHEHLYQQIRFTERSRQQSRDGLPLKNLEVGFGGEMFLRMTKPWAVMSALNAVGIGRIVPILASNPLRESSGAALITVPRIEFRSFLEGGQALERIWLSLTHGGVSVQLMTALPLFHNIWQLGQREKFSSQHQALLEQVWEYYRKVFSEAGHDGAGHVALMRFGYCNRPVQCRTLRRSEEEFLVR